MPKKGTIINMPRSPTIMRNLICPHCKLTNRVEVISGATIYIFCIHCETKMKWFEKNDGETSGKIITLSPPKDEPEKPKEPEIKWA
jgi:hypothetical protein